MTTLSPPPTTDLDQIGARPVPELEGVRALWPRGDRLRAAGEAAAAFTSRVVGDILGPATPRHLAPPLARCGRPGGIDRFPAPASPPCRW